MYAIQTNRSVHDQLDLPVLFAQVGHGVLEQQGVHPHLGPQQRHVAEDADKLLHAGLALGKVLLLAPGRPRHAAVAAQGRFAELLPLGELDGGSPGDV